MKEKSRNVVETRDQNQAANKYREEEMIFTEKFP